MIGGASATAAILSSGVLRSTPRRVSAAEKVNIGIIGAGGKGRADTHGLSSQNIVAMADVDWKRGAETFSEFPKAKKYKDFREMLDKENVDACTVTIPDHMHAYAAYHAMKMGKHVYVQKPLTYTVAEARLLRKTANEMGVMTQMGNQGHSGNGVRDLCEMVWSGAIGQVKEAHIWTNRPVWPQGMPAPTETMPVPDTLDWDKWIGTSAMRPYNKAYMPFNWRGFIDFGCGALGDMACHIADPANWALRLSEVGPTSVEAIQNEGMTDAAFPNKSIIRYEFPARGDQDPVTVYWYDGGNMPKRPDGITDKMGDGRNGSLLVGTDGVITAGEYGGNARLLPDAKMADYTRPPQTIPRIPNEDPYMNFVQGIKGGVKPCSNFDYAGPFSEWVVMGTLALKHKGKLEWDAKNMRVTNRPEANQHVTREYRKGWELPC
jgi:predicted dehydrogenase